MTSSYQLKKREETPDRWKFGLPGGFSNGMDSHYIQPSGSKNCHPDYMAVPIGSPWGAKVCVRKYRDNSYFDTSDNYKQNGYQRGAVNLYDVKQETPTQNWNPYEFATRRMPWEQDLLRRDYQRWPIRYNGTGITLMQGPNEGKDSGEPYYSYGYSFTPKEDKNSGMRVATSQDESITEPKYDTTRPYSPYTEWVKQQEYIREFPKDRSFDNNFAT